MGEERNIAITLGGSRWSKSWRTVLMSWDDFVRRTTTEPARSPETLSDYMKLPKSEQDDLKDVGGYVGGELEHSPGARRVENFQSRTLVTLDLDNIPAKGTEAVLDSVQALGVCAAVYSTRKHRLRAPRLRVVLPLAEPCPTEAYEPVARKIAEKLGINQCDPTTFEVNRLMYWPSLSSDGEFVAKSIDGPLLDPKEILTRYADWKDISQWPTAAGEVAKLRRDQLQQDPLTKKGIVGAFCRTYTVPEAMEAYLPGAYTPTVAADRYTYSQGSTANGAVVYADKWLYSHHATDPCSGQLVNAFDLIRIHLFGDLDADAREDTRPEKLPSFIAMADKAREDPRVQDQMAEDNAADIREKFGDLDVSPEDLKKESGWMHTLQLDGNGKISNTLKNAVIIIQNERTINNSPALNLFESRVVVRQPPAWDNQWSGVRPWTDTDSAYLSGALEHYGIRGSDKLDRAIKIVADKNKFNAVRDYLESLKWDGKERLGTLFVRYLGAEDDKNGLTRAMTEKIFTAAVARVMKDEVKFDNMIILSGPQGIGKSTLLRYMGKDKWFTDSVTQFEGKDAAELIQGKLVIEIGELQAMKRSEISTVKQFLSRQSDDYRPAYGHFKEYHPRRCVFFGTTNDTDFLKDQTGNRRFWPIECGIREPTASVWDDLPNEVDQLWAEAVQLYRIYGTSHLYLDREQEKLAQKRQEAHRDVSAWEGIIEEYLKKPVPENWYQMNREQMRMWAQNFNADTNVRMVPRTKVCAAEVWEFCLDGDVKRLNRGISAEINRIIMNLPEWKRAQLRFGIYGRCHGFIKDN